MHFSQSANAAYLPVTFYIDDFKISRPGQSGPLATVSTSAATLVTMSTAALNASVNAGSMNVFWGFGSFLILFVLNLVLLSVSSEMIGTPLERRFFREFERARQSTRQPLGHGMEN